MIAFLGLGSNLASPHRQLIQAIDYIKRQPEINIIDLSPIYHSKAMGNSAYPNYYNIAMKISTRLSPRQLLKQCQSIEHQFKRIRKKRWGPRTLDIDILLYGNKTIKTHELEIPHYQLTKRDFVIIPLLAIEPALQLPDGQQLSQIQFKESYLIDKKYKFCEKFNLFLKNLISEAKIKQQVSAVEELLPGTQQTLEYSK